MRRKRGVCAVRGRDITSDMIRENLEFICVRSSPFDEMDDRGFGRN